MTTIFDTETTGKAEFSRPPEDACQPRLVQLAALLLDSDLNEVSSMNFTIKPVGFTISDEVAKIHGITQAKAEQYGVSEHGVLLLFREWLLMSKTLVAHNIAFDDLVMGRAFAVHELKVDKMPTPYCTMKAATEACKIPGVNGYKWPKLIEAHQILLGTGFEGQHDALADVRACARIYEHLIHGDRPKALPVEPMNTRNYKEAYAPAADYNDNTPMPFGKHKGTPLGRLPEDYCNWLYDQPDLSDRQLYTWLHGK